MKLANKRMLAAIAYEKNCKEVLCCLKSKKERNKKKHRTINKIDYVLARRFK